MPICPFLNKECTIISGSGNCAFEVLPHTEEKPVGKKECAIKAALLLYIKQRRPTVRF